MWSGTGSSLPAMSKAGASLALLHWQSSEVQRGTFFVLPPTFTLSATDMQIQHSQGNTNATKRIFQNTKITTTRCSTLYPTPFRVWWAALNYTVGLFKYLLVRYTINLNMCTIHVDPPHFSRLQWLTFPSVLSLLKTSTNSLWYNAGFEWFTWCQQRCGTKDSDISLKVNFSKKTPNILNCFWGTEARERTFSLLNITEHFSSCRLLLKTV